MTQHQQEIAALPRHSNPRLICGVYFLLRGEQVVYVGQSINIIGRVLGHITEGKKEFDSYSFMECDRKDLDRIESRYIAAFDCEYNATMPPGQGFQSHHQWARHFGIPGSVFLRITAESGLMKSQKWYCQDDLKEFLDFMEFAFGKEWMGSRRRPTIEEIQMKLSCFRERTEDVGCF